jgi:hypothetical protein
VQKTLEMQQVEAKERKKWTYLDILGLRLVRPQLWNPRHLCILCDENEEVLASDLEICTANLENCITLIFYFYSQNKRRACKVVSITRLIWSWTKSNAAAG